ncbi:hypothetical protein HOL21_04740 [Candidatus Woesearchaeota archaeon]|jgi:hypothetical protein|nr:hypothetical protein [Candidatus Woesearchaeota archaeon]MBT5397493.1 hypothetical protein [Candidatus Woesearchaeota archaeon]MBT5924608.1 hypothetical protein [Candidatus Woesearchaeota archaeon]MBT6367934.1 hypothetical protein [Candidatus Woesearchaeota archaeon]MBT7763158.1 hypothetical protein [Candidatus Woesearchaeota archaeon]
MSVDRNRIWLVVGIAITVIAFSFIFFSFSNNVTGMAVSRGGQINLAFICYNQGCTYTDYIREYLVDEGFDVTRMYLVGGELYALGGGKVTSFNGYSAVVCAGHYLACSNVLKVRDNILKEAYRNNGVPIISVAHRAYTSSSLEITNGVGADDNFKTSIGSVDTTHDIMKEFSDEVRLQATRKPLYVGYINTNNIYETEYVALFGPGNSHSGSTAESRALPSSISGFALESGVTDFGRNPGKFVHLGFFMDDYKWELYNTDARKIVRNSICWAVTGSSECLVFEKCGDRIDNDGNGKVDCDDVACLRDPMCKFENCDVGKLPIKENTRCIDVRVTDDTLLTSINSMWKKSSQSLLEKMSIVAYLKKESASPSRSR